MDLDKKKQYLTKKPSFKKFKPEYKPWGGKGLSQSQAIEISDDEDDGTFSNGGEYGDLDQAMDNLIDALESIMEIKMRQYLNLKENNPFVEKK